MENKKVSVVTGAGSFTGRYLSHLLLERGEHVVSLTGHSDRRNRRGSEVEQRAYQFDDLDKLTQSLRGAGVLYNTYWIRFPHRSVDFSQAVHNSRQLFQAAVRAGISRVVHISITNPHQGTHLPYFAGKAEVEQALIDSGISYAILRPAVIYGQEDILLNNLAYFLRRLPVVLMPGDGRYRLRPIYVEDLAGLMAYNGLQSRNTILDAVGPDSYTYRELIHLLKTTVGSQTLVAPAPARLMWLLTKMINRWVGDVVLTWNEIRGLTEGLLDSQSLSAGSTSLPAWLQEQSDRIGATYHSELKRHYR